MGLGRQRHNSKMQLSNPLELEVALQRRNLISGSFGDPALDQAYRVHHFQVLGPRIRSRLLILCFIASLGSVARQCMDTQSTNVRSEQWWANLLLNFQTPLMWASFVMVSARYSIFTADNYERLFFGACLLNSAIRNVGSTFLVFEVQELPASVDWGLPPELQVTSMCVGILTRVNMFAVTAFFLLGLRPFSALILCVLDTTFLFSRRRQLLLGLPYVGLIPASAVFVAVAIANLGLVFFCACAPPHAPR